MEIKNTTLLQLSNVLYSFSNKKVPFALTVSKNIKSVNDGIEKYNENRLAIIDKFALKTDQGDYLGIVKPEPTDGSEFVVGERYIKPTNLNEIEIDNRDEMIKQIIELDNTLINVEIITLDLDKKYFDTTINSLSTIGDFIDTNIEANLIGAMVDLGLMSL